MRFSLELLPHLLKNAAATNPSASHTHRALAAMPHNTLVYLPDLPHAQPNAIRAAIQDLARLAPHLRPVPHIAASRVTSEKALLDHLDGWQAAAAPHTLTEVLVVRGDTNTHDTAAPGSSGSSGSLPNPPRGPFETSADLLESGVLQRRGIEAVGLAGHPEGVAQLSTADAQAHLLRKLDAAINGGLQPRVVTQFSFDTGAATAFVDSLRAAGVSAPVSLGLPGPAPASSLVRMARQCGVSEPEAALAAAWPDGCLEQLAPWQEARGPADGLQNLHLYAFGGVSATLRWLALESAPGGASAERASAWRLLGFEPPPLSMLAWARES